MAIPRGYRRGSGGDLQPIGKSGLVSGPGHGNVGMTMADFGPSKREREIRDKVMAGYKSRQAGHEKVMADIAKTESDTFKKINDALTASREVDAKNKDNLGRPMPPSQQTQQLESRLGSILIQRGEKAKQTATPAAAGITPEQVGDIKEFGAYGEKPMELQDTRGIHLPDQPTPEKDFSQPASVGETVEATREDGSVVQVTVVAPADANGMVRIKLQDGSEVAVPADRLARINVGDVSQIPGEPAPDPGGQRGRFQASEQRRAVLRDIGVGL
jgi:hypothetical protein